MSRISRYDTRARTTLHWFKREHMHANLPSFIRVAVGIFKPWQASKASSGNLGASAPSMQKVGRAIDGLVAVFHRPDLHSHLSCRIRLKSRKMTNLKHIATFEARSLWCRHTMAKKHSNSLTRRSDLFACTCTAPRSPISKM